MNNDDWDLVGFLWLMTVKLAIVWSLMTFFHTISIIHGWIAS